ncbi:uncharacterized protein LOC126897504 [Daktulosphaira vitifoliae]|uniref:uncharacterized protein LOC126897504 n=1 Tax=Daktulosphaira vitifoliae TaxID=58002 RepID=UPI0021AADEBC|nr:uncharacterized protein LOC126897504 [Daktulosphaira vitifoliae]
MLFRFFILNFYNFWILNQCLMVFCSSSSNSGIDDKYVINAFNTIRQQIGWDLDRSYGFCIGENSYQYYNMEEIMSEINSSNFLEKIPRINKLIILRYTEYLKIFGRLLNSFVQFCHHKQHSEEDFIHCCNELRNIVTISNRMFLKFLYVAIFLDHINSYLNTNHNLNLKSIITHIGVFYSLALKKPFKIIRLRTAKNMVRILKNFITYTIDKKISELDQINKSAIYNTHNSAHASLEVQYSMSRLQEIITNTVERHKTILIKFYKETLQDGYYDLGFDKLIVDNTKQRILSQIMNHHTHYNEEHENDNFDNIEDYTKFDDEDLKRDSKMVNNTI